MSASPHCRRYQQLLPLLAAAPVRDLRLAIRRPKPLDLSPIIHPCAKARHDGRFYTRWRDRQPRTAP